MLTIIIYDDYLKTFLNMGKILINSKTEAAYKSIFKIFFEDICNFEKLLP